MRENMAVQLDLFEELSEVDILRKELADVKQRSENVRRGIFARHNELSKLFLELKDEIDKLKLR